MRQSPTVQLEGVRHICSRRCWSQAARAMGGGLARALKNSSRPTAPGCTTRSSAPPGCRWVPASWRTPATPWPDGSSAAGCTGPSSAAPTRCWRCAAGGWTAATTWPAQRRASSQPSCSRSAASTSSRRPSDSAAQVFSDHAPHSAVSAPWTARPTRRAASRATGRRSPPRPPESGTPPLPTLPARTRRPPCQRPRPKPTIPSVTAIPFARFARLQRIPGFAVIPNPEQICRTPPAGCREKVLAFGGKCAYGAPPVFETAHFHADERTT